MIDEILRHVSRGGDLSMEHMREAVDQIMQGNLADAEVTLLLTSLIEKGETTEEIAGTAAALRMHMRPIHTTRQDLIDTCGTGGDGLATFNISTAAALVTAAAGAPVAKHGNRRVTGTTGSADVLDLLGVNIEADYGRVEACLDELGICFCFAPLWHGAMKRVADVRRRIGRPTIFNLVGPLANPASAPYQLIGVGKPHVRPLLAGAIARLGQRRTAIVHGEDGLDEVSLSGRTQVSLVDEIGVKELLWEPRDFGIQAGRLDDLRVSGPEQSAAVIRDVLAGKPGAPRDVVLLNAAAALWIAGKAATLDAAARKAAEAIDGGAAGDLLARLAARSHAPDATGI